MTSDRNFGTASAPSAAPDLRLSLTGHAVLRAQFGQLAEVVFEVDAGERSRPVGASLLSH